jgi:hypothetical protein
VAYLQHSLNICAGCWRERTDTDSAQLADLVAVWCWMISLAISDIGVGVVVFGVAQLGLGAERSNRSAALLPGPV